MQSKESDEKYLNAWNRLGAWAWPRNQFWFESLLQGDFVEDWWKENFRMSRRSNRSLTSLLSAMIEMLGRKLDNPTICSPRDVTYRHKRIYLSSWPWLPTVTMPDHRVITTFTLVKFLLSFAAFTKVSAGAPNDNFRKNICSEDDLRSRIFGTFVVNFLLACLS